MKTLLISWIGETDLRACENNGQYGVGPIASAITAREYAEIALLSDYPKKRTKPFILWLNQQTKSPVTFRYVKLTDPTDFEEIYPAAVEHVQLKRNEHGIGTSLTFHISPGTSQMGAVWIILAASKFPAELIKSSKEHGVRTANLPFEISADYIPDLLKLRDKELEKLAAGLPSESSKFGDIIHRSKEMQRVVFKAQRVALRSIPVLIEGESGTGKELFARAIHQASPRKNMPFIPVNCGAIPEQLIESELFGHKKGAFTGADKDRKGHFQSADGGTLFLDEIGELPTKAQVKLLRTLQEGEITVLGESTPRRVDVRIIAATNRSLIKEVSESHFREDLFYRLAVAVLNLPPLRERGDDVSLLIDRLMEIVNNENGNDLAYEHKNVSVSARKIMLQHSWPGNIRELLNTLHRAAVWSGGAIITEEDIKEAILPMSAAQQSRAEIKDHSIDNGIDLHGIISDVACHYLKLAMEKTHNNKTKAAKILGMPSYQTLTNWLKKYGLE